MISDKTRSDIIRIAVIWVIVSAIVEAVTAYFAGGYSGTASLQGEVTSDAIFFLLRVTIPVFVLVAVVIFYSMLRFRVADDDAAPSESQDPLRPRLSLGLGGDERRPERALHHPSGPDRADVHLVDGQGRDRPD